MEKLETRKDSRIKSWLSSHEPELLLKRVAVQLPAPSLGLSLVPPALGLDERPQAFVDI